METATQVICHDSKSKLINMGGHVATAAVSAAALVALFKYVRQPSLAVLTGSSVACITLPLVPVALGERQKDNARRYSPIGTKLVRTGSALSGFVGGAQMMLIGLAALRTWNSGLSRLKKVGIVAILTLSAVELAAMKGLTVALMRSCKTANIRAGGGNPYPTYYNVIPT